MATYLTAIDTRRCPDVMQDAARPFALVEMKGERVVRVRERYPTAAGAVVALAWATADMARNRPRTRVQAD